MILRLPFGINQQPWRTETNLIFMPVTLTPLGRRREFIDGTLLVGTRWPTTLDTGLSREYPIRLFLLLRQCFR